MKRYLFLTALLIPTILLSQYERHGTTLGLSLRIGPHAKACGMGEAYLSIADDASALYYNPAGLSLLEGSDIFATHIPWFIGINYEFVGIAHRFPRWGTIGFSFATLYTEKMKVTTPFHPDGTGEYFYWIDYSLGLSYARALTDKASLGITVKFIRLDCYGYYAQTLCGDIGTLFQTGWMNTRFGMKISNFGLKLKFIDETNPLPTSFAFGVSTQPLEELTIGLVISKPTDLTERGSIGGEYRLLDMFTIRAGYKFGFDEETWSAGVGFEKEMGKIHMKLDYAYSEFGYLGKGERFSLGVAF
ncbi:PorV/PorQ family protein [candidate division WOR-3 bacterium]|nr:PorV/PorQ family protein [candidate division WOR-3 bacterium]MCK4528099.1 PorV/PorQ family protein [candidate division WOR-3 bacterium]